MGVLCSLTVLQVKIKAETESTSMISKGIQTVVLWKSFHFDLSTSTIVQKSSWGDFCFYGVLLSDFVFCY